MTIFPDISVNYKEYLAWFRMIYGFEFLHQGGTPARTTVLRTAQAFRDLGIRFSKYNRRTTLKGISHVLDSRQFDYVHALKVAIYEDAVAYWQKLNKGKTYVHMDFEAGAKDPE